MIIVSADPDIAPFMIVSHYDRGIHPCLHQQIGVGRRNLAADARSGSEKAQGRCIIHIGFGSLFVRFPVIEIIPEEIIIQGSGFLQIRIILLQSIVQDLFNLGGKIRDPGGSLFPGDKIGELRDAVLDGVPPIPGIIDQFRQYGETQPGKLAHHPVIGLLIRAGKGILAGHDRVHQVIPGFTHGFAEDFLHIDGADPGPENIAVLSGGFGSRLRRDGEGFPACGRAGERKDEKDKHRREKEEPVCSVTFRSAGHCRLFRICHPCTPFNECLIYSQRWAAH